MPLFRVETTSEVLRIMAMRVVDDGQDLSFESPAGSGAWRTERRVPRADVVKVTRRVMEVSGAIGWVVERPTVVGRAM